MGSKLPKIQVLERILRIEVRRIFLEVEEIFLKLKDYFSDVAKNAEVATSGFLSLSQDFLTLVF